MILTPEEGRRLHVLILLAGKQIAVVMGDPAVSSVSREIPPVDADS